LSQSREEAFDFARELHGTIKIIPAAITVWLGKTERKSGPTAPVVGPGLALVLKGEL
jgi:hypothetical protein